jgi:Uma2 family endonuclease
MSAMQVPKLSVEEYLAMERATDSRSEYHDGEIFPVVAATWEHARVAANVGHCLSGRLGDGACHLVNSSIRVQVSPSRFVYPDFAVVCGKPVFTDQMRDTYTNPKVIVEVLSPSTRDYDYGGKFTLYRLLPSFEEYLLIAQDEPRIEVFRKASDEEWILKIYKGLEATVRVQSLNIELRLAEIYFEVAP